MKPVTTLPPLIVEAGPATLPAEALASLQGVRVQQRLSLPTQAELTFCDPPGFLAAALGIGAMLRLSVAGHRQSLFAGQVTAVESVYGPAGQRELHVRGYDRLYALHKRQSVRAHVQVTLEELAQELVAGLGLVVQVAGGGERRHWPRLFQHHHSDLDLLVDAAEQAGLYLTLRGDTLHLITLDGSSETVPLTLGESLLEARLERNDEPAAGVTAAGWDAGRAEAYSGRAGAGRRHWLNRPFADEASAQTLAQAELGRQLAQAATFWGVAEGNPSLHPGVGVLVNGVAPALAGRYVLTEVTHRLDPQLGFVSELSTVPPPPRFTPGRSGGTALTLGIVSQVNDPDQRGRVRVTLPAFENAESNWLGVLGVAAGPAKGLIALPDRGDRVLVALLHHDPAQAIVLGGLYGTERPPDSGVEGGAVRRYTFVTPGGQRLRLDDSGVVRLENSAGSYLELGPDRLCLHANTPLEMEAPGQAIVIRGRSVDFQQG